MAKLTNYQRSLRRRLPNKDPYNSVLIVCEGSKSEPRYLLGLIRFHRLNSANIKVTHAPGSDPMSIVNYAEKLALNAAKNGEPYDKVYCVFDRDSHANYAEALDTINNSEYPLIAITSSPCFEVWPFLHFSNSTAPFSAGGGRKACENVIKAIHEAGFPEYSKNTKNLYQTLLDKIETAILNAKRLTKHNAENNSFNPATNFHILVEDLRNIKTLDTPLKEPPLDRKAVPRKSHAVV